MPNDADSAPPDETDAPCDRSGVFALELSEL